MLEDAFPKAKNDPATKRSFNMPFATPKGEKEKDQRGKDELCSTGLSPTAGWWGTFVRLRWKRIGRRAEGHALPTARS